jgi:hypothetical protein
MGVFSSHGNTRFTKALGGVVGKTLKYAKLIAAEGGDGIQPAGQTA